MRESICLALGFFDSVHYGHRVIIDKLKNKAEALAIKPILSTFTDSFTKFPHGGKLIYTLEERKSILSDLSIENILLFDFNEAFKNQPPQMFLQSLLQKYDPKYIVCGYDYRYGEGGKGDTATLQHFCKNNDIQLEIVDEVCKEGERISSSKIKKFLLGGDIENANDLLCNDYFIIGSVERGRGEGKANSIPTANIALPQVKLIPKSGVYATTAVIDNKKWTAVTNIGEKPTYGDFSCTVETHVVGFNNDIYDKEIRIVFHKYLREIQKFDSKAALREQIKRDICDSHKLQNDSRLN